jgi:peptidoglycan/LPS O-acetylase OafA/YrhL
MINILRGFMKSNMPHNKQKKFRADIEGMRAIAILLVVAAHFAIPGFFAGFIGVDIFFVISGYLITGILVGEYEKTQRITLAKFYANRLRRLLPALAAMVIVSSCAAFWVLPQSQNLAHSVAGSMAILWISNIFFAFSDVNYFAAGNITNIFLHTWSLGVEEQFYLVWPAFILISMSFFKTKTNNQRLLICFLLISIISLASCIFFIRHNPVIAFYMMPTRAWQFAAGALAWLFGRYKLPSMMPARVASWLGVAFLVLGLVLINANSAYPSLLAIFPTLGACFLLWSGSGQTKTNTPNIILSMPIMQKIGKLSYSLYLWHWPVLIVGSYFFPIKGNIGNTIFAMIFSLVLASATSYLIENPVRFGQAANIVPRWQIFISIVVMILISSQLLRWNTYAQKQIASSTNQLYIHAISDVPVIYPDGCDDWYHSAEVKLCTYGNKDAKHTAVLMGDSIGAQWFSAITHMHNLQDWSIIVLTKSSCPMVDQSFFYTRIGREYTECSAWRNKAIEWLQHQHVDQLFIGGTASSNFTDEQWQAGTASILKKLTLYSDSIFLIESNPTLTFNGPNCLLKYKTNIDRYKNCQSAPANLHYAKVAGILSAVTKQFPNVHWLETSNFVCPDHMCDALRKNDEGQFIAVYRDEQHLTDTFAASAAKNFDLQITAYANNATTH